MGGATITVPDGVAVDMGGFALLGGDDLDVAASSPGRRSPAVRVRSYSLMGGSTVRDGRR